MESKKFTIAYGLCGEGFGHYGRSVGIIKLLAQMEPNVQVDVYTYGYSLKILSIDQNLPDNISINKIPGFLFKHNQSGKINIFNTLLSLNNLLTFVKTAMIILSTPFVSLFARIFKAKKDIIFSKYFKHFDYAVTDFEASLPRVARIRGKKFTMIDSLHVMLFATFKGIKFTPKESFKLFINRMFIKMYHPVPKMALLTTLYDFHLKNRYKSRVKQVGSLIRKDIVDLLPKATYGDYILVYLRANIRKRILPIFAQYTGVKFVIFTEDIESPEVLQYKTKWIEFKNIDPKNFIEYLSKCKAVVSTSGYTLICEALSLQKPFFGIKIGGILGFEQKLSLISLQKLNLGNGCKINKFSNDILGQFIGNIDEYKLNFKDVDITDHTEKVVEIIIEDIERTNNIKL